MIMDQEAEGGDAPGRIALALLRTVVPQDPMVHGRVWTAVRLVRRGLSEMECDGLYQFVLAHALLACSETCDSPAGDSPPAMAQGWRSFVHDWVTVGAPPVARCRCIAGLLLMLAVHGGGGPDARLTEDIVGGGPFANMRRTTDLDQTHRSTHAKQTKST